MRRLSVSLAPAFLALALLAIACAEDLASLSPYPCAEDGTCPAGLSCSAAKLCECPTGTMACDGTTCMDVLSDVKNCGGCGVVSPTYFCNNGCPVATLDSACSQGPLCGCAGGQNCYFDSVLFDWLCAPVGATPLGGDCTEAGECAAGLGCTGDGVGTQKHCLAYCSQDDPCPSGQSCCLIGVTAADGGAVLGSQSNSCFPGPSCD